jgi:fructoselysine-6-P-deglycase FrlB-like protein
MLVALVIFLPVYGIEAIARALLYGARMDGYRVVLGGFDKNRERVESVSISFILINFWQRLRFFFQIHNLLLTGCGTSRFAAEYAAKLMRELDCLETVAVLDSAEVRGCDIPKHAGGLLAVSQSGLYNHYAALFSALLNP